jgi:hypothetical protein
LVAGVHTWEKVLHSTKKNARKPTPAYRKKVPEKPIPSAACQAMVTTMHAREAVLGLPRRDKKLAETMRLPSQLKMVAIDTALPRISSGKISLRMSQDTGP